MHKALLLDTYFSLYLWTTLDAKNDSTELKRYCQLASDYALVVAEQNNRSIKLEPLLVVANYEPLEFIAAFPAWFKQGPLKLDIIRRKDEVRVFPIKHLI